MKFSRHQLGEKLKNELAKGYDIHRISNWAFELEDKTLGARDKEVSTLLNCLCIMPGGPEYEYTEKELKTICELLLNEEKDPIKIIDKMRIERRAENALDVNYSLMKFLRRQRGDEKSYPCACCGFLTMSELECGSFEICPVCFWEDDNVQFNNIDYTGGANKISLREARKNFKKFKTCSLEFLKDVRPPRPEEIPHESNQGRLDF